MSLVRLLAAGKSLMGLKEPGGRYHLANHGLLPRFEPKKNPFRSGYAHTVEVAETTQPEDATFSAGVGEHQAVHGDRTGSEDKTPKSETDVRNSLSKLFGWFKRRSPVVQKPASSRSKGLVQAELTLESVQVVRNDLSDSDLEIVTARSGTRRDSEDELVAAPGIESQMARVREGRACSEESQQGRQRATGLKFAATALVGRFFGAGRL
jgi:hypothetical protein